MTFGWVVGYTPGVLKMNTQTEQFPYPRPIMFNFQLLRNDDHKQIHKSKYWLDKFFGEPDPIYPIPFFFFWGGDKKPFVSTTACWVLQVSKVELNTRDCAVKLMCTWGKLSQELPAAVAVGWITGKWYIYLLIYHQKSNYECRCRCITCMDPMGLFVFSCWHPLMCWGEMCWYAQVHQKKLMLMVPNSKSDWECQPKACLNNKNTSIGYKI